MCYAGNVLMVQHDETSPPENDHHWEAHVSSSTEKLQLASNRAIK